MTAFDGDHEIIGLGLSFTARGDEARTRSLSGKVGEVVSVLDFIPASKHVGIRAGTNTDDLTEYFQRAAASAAAGAPIENVAVGEVHVPNGVYHLTKVGGQGTVFRGQSRDGAVLRAVASGTSNDYLIDGMLDRDGVTPNTTGGGWCENLSFEGNLPNGTPSGRSGLRIYGGGVAPRELDIRNCAYGLAVGLPLWANISNVYTKSCDIGIYTFHNSPGDNGTSTTFINCWADSCATYGFYITQLYYSQFIGCVSQNSGTYDFYLNGNANGNAACYSIMFIGCGTESSGLNGAIPFYIKKAVKFQL